MVADYGFTEQVISDGVEFTITPPPFDLGSRAGFTVFQIWMTFCIAVGGTFLFGWMIGGSGAFLLFLFIGIWIGGYWWMRKRSQRAMTEVTQTARILVSAAGIKRNGQDFSRADIHDIFVNDPRPDHGQVSYMSTTVVSESGLAGAATGVGIAINESARQAGADAGRAFAAHVNQRGFAVMIRYGARDVPLVEAIEQGVAETLARRISISFSAMSYDH